VFSVDGTSVCIRVKVEVVPVIGTAGLGARSRQVDNLATLNRPPDVSMRMSEPTSLLLLGFEPRSVITGSDLLRHRF
jgi:hypothetical protein